jgi:hypothetical protein
VNIENLSKVRREARRHFRNKKREYLKDRINELESNRIRTTDLHRDTNEFKKAYQPRTNLLKDESGDLLADPLKIFNRKNYLSAVECTQGR